MKEKWNSMTCPLITWINMNLSDLNELT